jgi:hypothetical protein
MIWCANRANIKYTAFTADVSVEDSMKRFTLMAVMAKLAVTYWTMSLGAFNGKAFCVKFELIAPQYLIRYTATIDRSIKFYLAL